MEKPKSPDKSLTVRDLYPHLNGEELHEAEANLEAYLKVAWRIYERIRMERETAAQSFDSVSKYP